MFYPSCPLDKIAERNEKLFLVNFAFSRSALPRAVKAEWKKESGLLSTTSYNHNNLLLLTDFKWNNNHRENY